MVDQDLVALLETAPEKLDQAEALIDRREALIQAAGALAEQHGLSAGERELLGQILTQQPHLAAQMQQALDAFRRSQGGTQAARSSMTAVQNLLRPGGQSGSLNERR